MMHTSGPSTKTFCFSRPFTARTACSVAFRYSSAVEKVAAGPENDVIYEILPGALSIPTIEGGEILVDDVSGFCHVRTPSGCELSHAYSGPVRLSLSAW